MLELAIARFKPFGNSGSPWFVSHKPLCFERNQTRREEIRKSPNFNFPISPADGETKFPNCTFENDINSLSLLI